MKNLFIFLLFFLSFIQNCSKEVIQPSPVQSEKTKEIQVKYTQAELDEFFLKALRNQKINEAHKWLKEGANINFADEIDGFTGLHFVVYAGDIKSGEWLLSQKPNLEIKNKQGMSALHLAIREGNIELVKSLLKHGADAMDKELKNGWTALDFAAFWGHLDIAELLLTQKIDINHQDVEGNTALHKALTKSDLKMIKYLLEKGAQPNLKNLEGQTPYSFAKSDEARSLLKQFGGKE